MKERLTLFSFELENHSVLDLTNLSRSHPGLIINSLTDNRNRIAFEYYATQKEMINLVYQERKQSNHVIERSKISRRL
jgi:hypothetical protein